MEEQLEKLLGRLLKCWVLIIVRQNQPLVVMHFLRGCGVFVSMPTGSEKSPCYCLLPIFSILQQKHIYTQPSEENHTLML